MAPSLIAQIREICVRSGTFFLCVAFAGLTGDPIGGALVGQDNGGFLYLQIFCGVAIVLGSAGYVGARCVQCGWKPKII